MSRLWARHFSEEFISVDILRNDIELLRQNRGASVRE